MKLILGNKNYSSWSLRPWLVMQHHGLSFDEVIVPLLVDGFKDNLLKYSDAGKVPVLQDGDLTIWDSLAIMEYLNEKFPDLNLWPTDTAARATARCVSAQMHSGFANIRNEMPMNMRRDVKAISLSDDCLAEVQEVCVLWESCRENYGQSGLFLFGAFSIADAMFAPVVSRFTTYDVQVSEISKDYMQAVWALDAMQLWKSQGLAEEWVIEAVEI